MSRRLAACVAACAGTLLIGCSTAAIQNAIVGGGACRPGPVVYLIVDTSKSTDGQRRDGGPYERAAMKVVRGTARACGSLFAAPVDGNGVAYSEWKIDGKAFKEAFGGNEELNADSRVRNAQRELRPVVRELLHTHVVAGSDILGALQRVALTTSTVPSTRRRLLVLLSDGALFVRGRYDVYGRSVATVDGRRRFIDELRREDEIPDLSAFDGIYLSGLGIGMKGRNTALGTLKLWQQELVVAMRTQLKSADSTLRFP